MKNVTWIFLMALAIGCGRANRNQTAAEAVETAAAQVKDQVRETILVPSPADGTVKMPLSGDAGSLTIRKEAGKPVYLDFELTAPSHVHAEIVPVVEAANVRFSRIVLPDGATDGPFGRQVDYAVPSAGKVRLEIGESMMQGEPWGGEFKVDVKLTR